MQVSKAFATTSGLRFLGTDDGDLFQSGDNFTLTFAASNAIGMYFITHDTLLDEDIQLTRGGGAVNLLAADIQQTLNDGSSVYFLGLVAVRPLAAPAHALDAALEEGVERVLHDSASTFSSADVTSFCCGAFLFNVDDIVRAGPQSIPEPGTLTLVALGLAGLGFGFGRRKGGKDGST